MNALVPRRPMLTLQHYTAATDPEAARYRLLAAFADARRAFASNRVYPHLAALLDVRRALAALLDARVRHEAHPSGAATGVDWEAGRLVREPAPDAAAPLLAADLAAWSLPRLDDAIEEGRTLYDFADEHAYLAPVGLVPRYQQEGFLIVSTDDAVRALRYHASVLAGPDGRRLSLRTRDVEVHLAPGAPPSDWKARLAATAAELPAPAAFLVRAEIDLPFGATLLPLAKRKLLAAVHGEA